MSKKKIINPFLDNGSFRVLRGSCYRNSNYPVGPAIPSITCRSSDRFVYGWQFARGWGFRIKLVKSKIWSKVK